jgi:hypothetical protein
MKKLTLLAICLLLSGCALIQTTTLSPEAEGVRLYDEYRYVADCQYLGDIIGTEGRWFNYLFISNKALTQGALNDLKNQSISLGADSVHTKSHLGFETSVTYFGQAFQCL